MHNQAHTQPTISTKSSDFVKDRSNHDEKSSSLANWLEFGTHNIITLKCVVRK